MINYVIRRIIQAVIVCLLVATFAFFLLHLIPGDPAIIIAGENASKVQVEAVRAKLKLDRPILVQYFDWMGKLVRLDLGESLWNKMPVATRISSRLLRTLEIILFSVVIGSIVGIILGVLAACHHRSSFDSFISGLSVIGLSSPVYVVGIIFVLVFSLWLKLLPTAGYIEMSRDFSGHLRCLIMPVLALAVPQIGTIGRLTRSCMVDTLSKEYILTAWSKGLSARIVLYKHALRNASIPVVSMIGITAGSLLGSTVIVEAIFNWPGISSLLIDATYQRDYPVIQGVLVVIAFLFILINLLTDLVNAYLNPKIRLE